MEKFQGLSKTEAEKRLKLYGYNELPTEKPKSIFYLIASIIKEPMIFLLLGAGIIYLLLGEPKDSIVLFSSIVLVIGITFYQERKTENALQALRDLSSPRALVIRDWDQFRIPGREVVKEDIILLQEGDRVPADAIVINTQNLLIDESLLTGESLPVSKESIEVESILDIDKTTNINNKNIVYSGTLVAQGSGIAKVKYTGLDTEMGKIGKTLQTIVDEDSLLKKEINSIVRIFGTVGLIACIILVILYFYINGNILEAFLSGLTLSMAMLPEEFPLVLIIFLTLGAWRIAKKHVLTRNNQSIETLGATTVLCVDKTGTLTFNHMTLSTISSLESETHLDNIGDSINKSKKIKLASKLDNEILKYAKLSCKRTAFDPLEKELNEKFEEYLPQEYEDFKTWHLLKEYPLSKDLFAVTRVWKQKDSDIKIVASKGAPEAILSLCTMKESDKKKVMEIVSKLSNTGQRVLAVAKSEYKNTNDKENNFPESPSDFTFTFLGLVGFIDPLRPTVYESVQRCYEAGINVIMITGDYPGTAQYIAKQAGIKNTENYITGDDLKTLNKEELIKRLDSVNIFARVVPEQKLQIMEALKSRGEIVAMTGDGVNDGPALKSAHIGIAMGERGTDVARESADLVLLDDDFTSIVSAIELGRRIYDNLQKAVSYIFSIHIPIAGIALLPTILGFPPVLFPIHIAFLELIIDPACSTIYEAEKEEDNIMKRKPRNISQALFGKKDIFIGFLEGITLLSIIILVYVISINLGKDENSARTLAFTTMVTTNLVLIFANLSKDSIFKKIHIHRNKAFYVIATITMMFVLGMMTVPFMRDLFYFSQVQSTDILVITTMTLVCFVLLELLKLLGIKRIKSI